MNILMLVLYIGSFAGVAALLFLAGSAALSLRCIECGNLCEHHTLYCPACYKRLNSSSPEPTQSHPRFKGDS